MKLSLMTRLTAGFLTGAALLVCQPADAARVRIKDIADYEGVQVISPFLMGR
ncbi:hypothetical protein LOC54_07355 [Acetobacter sp. AN02]|uniref:hypothetical protein n=1 Tax=Acetobacter sp. AN02 TaxID=2894186 RepID=UPI00243446B5|nr:hypothetical protein [Acetobacter sp. AN02]MDG6094928.1 hypothetical protein [Acetobacter sp. AN02]